MDFSGANVDLLPYLWIALRILLILIGAFVLSRFAGVAIRRVRSQALTIMKTHGDMGSEAVEKRAKTISGILRTTTSVVVWAVAVVMCLNEAGFDIGPLLAGAGIAGIAIGFGAQSLVRDVISGSFMLLEDQIRVGDVVLINGTGGLVEEINLRTTTLRGLDGAVHIFPNGTIQTVSNLTRDYSYYVFDMGVAYKEDTDRVAAVMREVAAELQQDPQFAPRILEPLEVIGLDRFADSAVIIKARIKTKPIEQWSVGRELNRRFKKRFDELGIEIPYPHLSLHLGEASPAAGAMRDPAAREQMKQIIREVLDEKGR